MIADNYRFIINFFFHLIPATKTCKKKKKKLLFSTTNFSQQNTPLKISFNDFHPLPKIN